MQEIHLTLAGRVQEYTITVGANLFEEAGRLFDVGQYSKVLVVTDEHVRHLWFDKLQAVLPHVDSMITLPSGEQAKRIENVQRIWKAMREAACDRRSLVIILGGGVVGDMAAFAASTYMRGVSFAQIPTTLLAQVDSSIGGKTGFDFDDIKNLIGVFAQPVAVLVDTDTLSTLPRRELVAGFAEMFKHGLIKDAVYFERLSQKTPKEYSTAELAEFVARSIRIKAAVVTNDEYESGERKLLNFGHTIGHAVEARSWETESPLLHGEAVAIGMIVEAELSKQKGLISEDDVQRIRKILSMAGLPTVIPHSLTQSLFEKIRLDKKNEHGIMLFTLLKRIGEAVYNQTIEESVLARAITDNMESANGY